jgi:hypothetical protein
MEKASLELVPAYDYPRLKLLFALLERQYGLTIGKQRSPLAMDFELQYAGGSVGLSIHISTGKKGFWGFMPEAVEWLNKFDDWHLALLLRREDKHMADGWLILRRQWNALEPNLSRDAKRHYKINRSNLDNDEKLSGLEKIASAVAENAKRGT